MTPGGICIVGTVANLRYHMGSKCQEVSTEPAIPLAWRARLIRLMLILSSLTLPICTSPYDGELALSMTPKRGP